MSPEFISIFLDGCENEHDVSIIGSEKRMDSLVVVGQFLENCLAENKKVAVLSEQKLNKIMQNFIDIGFNLSPYIESGEMSYLTFNRDFLRNFSLHADFRGLFEDIEIVSDPGLDYLVILNIDSIFSAQSESMVADNIDLFRSESEPLRFKILGQFSSGQGIACKYLTENIASEFSNYLYISKAGMKMTEDVA